MFVATRADWRTCVHVLNIIKPVLEPLINFFLCSLNALSRICGFASAENSAQILLKEIECPLIEYTHFFFV